MLGNPVREVDDEKKVEQARAIYWDGKDGKGKMVLEGIYYYELEINGLKMSDKLIKMD